ncbi:hypothetical protein H8K35_15220 [Undibacterium sp. LX40W]|uniref:Uncharacterized protein n=1 Tax=Undibacterium nitidum TaxID=2762298 RepID=A0A923KUL0_9BURK|nr:MULTISPECIES: hypothetical protein [Undibacterium]MBC3882794.1 hypothetical protein [Undibacterium nitidum]MBC3893023.1 hypothetical protein [Undibacterium sp. LX40W]
MQSVIHQLKAFCKLFSPKFRQSRAERSQKSLWIAAVFALISSLAIAQVPTQATVSASEVLGTWKVDLRPTPDAAPYFQEFVVTKINPNNTFEGTFYGAPITQGRINTTWGAVRIAFVTADQSGPYNHSAVLKGGHMEGLTNSTGREFLAYWSAVKQ